MSFDQHFARPQDRACMHHIGSEAARAQLRQSMIVVGLAISISMVIALEKSHRAASVTEARGAPKITQDAALALRGASPFGALPADIPASSPGSPPARRAPGDAPKSALFARN